MKKIVYIFSFILVFSAIWSCENALDEDPQTDYLADTVITSEQGLDVALNGLFSLYTGYDYKGSRHIILQMPHSGTFWSAQNANSDATSLRCLPINVNLASEWKQMYSTINMANVIIETLEESDQEFTNGDVSLGYAYFIRGMVYFDLARYHGGVPLRTKPASTSELHKARSTKEEVYTLVISDFTQAKQLLAENGGENGENPERPLKYAANMMLSKVYMQLAGEDNGDPSLWQNAYDELLPVIGQYSLVSSYAALFDPANENSQEAVFELNYSTAEGDNNFGAPKEFTPTGEMPGNNTWGRTRPNKEVFVKHAERYGLNGGSIVEGQYVTFDPAYADPRIDATFFYNKHIKNYGTSQTANIYPKQKNGKNGYTAIKKYVDLTYSPPSTNRNHVMLRYADALLMMAEIQNELSGPSAGYSYVNQVLARARDIDGNGVSDTVQPADWDATSVPDQETFRNLIMQEYMYELMGESHEWFNARRRGYDYFKANVIDTHIATGNSDFDYPDDPATISTAMLLPIPQDELNTNNLISQSDQNPGY